MGVQFLLVIPIINIILVIVWAFSSKHSSRRNYCIAAIIWFLIFVTLSSVAVYQFDNPVTVFMKNINNNWRRVPEIIAIIEEKGVEVFNAMDPAPTSIAPEPTLSLPDAEPTPEPTIMPEETFMPDITSTPDPT
jgi:hypothetical protein